MSVYEVINAETFESFGYYNSISHAMKVVENNRKIDNIYHYEILLNGIPVDLGNINPSNYATTSKFVSVHSQLTGIIKNN